MSVSESCILHVYYLCFTSSHTHTHQLVIYGVKDNVCLLCEYGIVVQDENERANIFFVFNPCAFNVCLCRGAMWDNEY